MYIKRRDFILFLFITAFGIIHWIISFFHFNPHTHLIVGVLEVICLLLLLKCILDTKWADKQLVPSGLLENLPAAVITVNVHGDIVNINDLAKEITGLNHGLEQSNINHMTFGNDNLFYFLKQTLDQKEIYQDHNYTYYQRGVPRYFWLRTATILDRQGQVAGALLIAWNISEQKILEKQLSQREKLAMIGELAAGTAHEIRNPLTSIRGLIQVLEPRFHSGDPAKEYVSIMLKEIDHINHIIKELLLLARRASPNLSFASLPAVLDHVLVLIEGESSLRGVRLHKNYKNDLPLVILDEDQMKQVFLHLCTNAIYAMPTGGDLTVDATYNEKENQISISFEDTGSGISEPNLSRIFHPFFTTRPEGTGLGLPISYQIVYNHGGSLSVESNLGKGSIFVVALPLVNSEKAAAS